jgi:hypothetical protein
MTWITDPEIVSPELDSHDIRGDELGGVEFPSNRSRSATRPGKSGSIHPPRMAFVSKPGVERLTQVFPRRVLSWLEQFEVVLSGARDLYRSLYFPGRNRWSDDPDGGWSRMGTD